MIDEQSLSVGFQSGMNPLNLRKPLGQRVEKEVELERKYESFYINLCVGSCFLKPASQMEVCIVVILALLSSQVYWWHSVSSQHLIFNQFLCNNFRTPFTVYGKINMSYRLTPGLYPMQGSIHAPEMLKIIMCKTLRGLRMFFEWKTTMDHCIRDRPIPKGLKSIDPQ